MCAPNVTGPTKAPEPQDAGENDNSLQLCSLAVCLLAAASTQTTQPLSRVLCWHVSKHQQPCALNQTKIQLTFIPTFLTHNQGNYY